MIYNFFNSLVFYISLALITTLTAIIISAYNNFLIKSQLSPIYKALFNDEINENTELTKKLTTLISEKMSEYDQIKQMYKFRSEFLSNVSHELKNPLFNIQGYLYTIVNNKLPQDKQHEFLNKALTNTERMINIIKDLETISLMEEGKMQINLSKFNVVELINEIITLLIDKANEHSIKMHLINNSSYPYVYADRKKIGEVLYNLILNSIFYGKENGQVTITIIDIGEKLMIEVADNGIGIESHHLPFIFDRFYRVDKTRSKNKGGTGLGLSIVKHILELHNEKIFVKSVYGVGSTFSFSLKKA
ncbi:MAG: ATP-binding protein [Bacteroidales bacterium]|nr:ATP-binding protein [Bacteroidales bacterium]